METSKNPASPLDGVVRAYGVPCEVCSTEAGHYKTGPRWLCYEHTSLRLETGMTDFRNNGGEVKDPTKPIPGGAHAAFSSAVAAWDLKNPVRPEWFREVEDLKKAGRIRA